MYAYSWAQYGVGTSQPLLTDVTSKWPHFEAKWFRSLRQYLRNIGGEIRLKDTYVPRTQRKHNVFLMDIVLSSKKFGPASIRRINYCRLYLNVTLLSDITRPDGSRLDKAAYDGNLTQLLSTNPGLSVNQPKPNNKAWQEWRKFLHLLVHRDVALHLKNPLTEWIVAPSQYTRRWKYLYSRDQDRLFVRTTVGYLVHHRL